VKYAWIDAQRREFPLPDMCQVLGVSNSGWRAWRCGGKPDRTRLGDAQAVALIKSIHAEVRGPTARGACTPSCRRAGTASASAASSA
jgi:putative transposase